MARMLPYDPTWEDMSDYVVHFARPKGLRSDYDNMLNICWSQMLKPGGPFGIARGRAPEPQSQYAVCMSEIPLHQLRRLAKRRGGYGIGFTKQFVVARGGGPVWYAEKGGTIASAISTLIRRAQHSVHSAIEPIWTLTAFIDVPGDYAGGPYRFEWEREWRHVESFNSTRPMSRSWFSPKDCTKTLDTFFGTTNSQALDPPTFVHTSTRIGLGNEFEQPFTLLGRKRALPKI
jgi:hypothetical protein